MEDNASGSSPTVCAVPPDVGGVYEGELGWRHWLVLRLLSVVKYLLFGAFVLACNKLRRVIGVKRQRNSSSSSSVDGVDVSHQGTGGQGGNGRERLGRG